MPVKKVSIGKKPGTPDKLVGIEEWVANREDTQAVEPPKENLPEKMKQSSTTGKTAMPSMPSIESCQMNSHSLLRKNPVLGLPQLIH